MRPARGSNAAREHQEKMKTLNEILGQYAYFFKRVDFYFLAHDSNKISMRLESHFEFDTPALDILCQKF